MAPTLWTLLAATAALCMGDYFAPVENDNTRSICGPSDFSQSIACFKNDQPTRYKLAQAVARLHIPGTFCTGWLWGSEGHLITNSHCVGSQYDADSTAVELGATCASCDDPNNGVRGGCPGTIVANSTTTVMVSYYYDFALLKLNLNVGVDLSSFGYLKARQEPAMQDEAIYLLGHAAFKPSRISYLRDDHSFTRVTNVSTTSACREGDVIAHDADTEGGSSGSPVIAVTDNTVIALHNCAGCAANGGQNSGRKMSLIVAYLRSKNLLPKDAVADA
ncbi:Aste57867_23823 [Aphanomyces stellatus]|uniref:Aste57867_1267 protein n=1 Tax=Aphanomyces stellatus TaxID=120398 RepID=A0A485KH65_9STRA|nr:hypothetical protein As57867_023750 [Aphanomyces stellatus]KAF0711586.1 hypothetical protein As57867_005177 [Aphanomyces stellatus]KAF0711587.1 hypothetical protein As57867_005178 [Aphanomyces stellatus]KAF0719112.1 hypothetical protein As57867_001266 [Aphanomyces stellatus]VFT78486.1 Aste57867_1267 [Aphanomyces stellatus]